MERTKSTENYGNLNFDCSYSIYNYDNGGRTVDWNIAIHAYSAGPAEAIKALKENDAVEKAHYAVGL